MRRVARIGSAFLLLVVSCCLARAQTLNLHGINYNSRQGPDWAPISEKCKSAADIQQDMATLSQVTGIIRLYSLTDCDQTTSVIPVAVNAGMQVSIGLWVSNDEAVFAAEKAQFLLLVQNRKEFFTSGKIIGVHVGSEAIYRKEVTAAKNIEYMQQIKNICEQNGIDTPVTIADIGDTYLAYPELIDAVDVVSANAFPFWEKIPIENAASHFLTRITPLVQLATGRGKELFISETGWASNGINVNASLATPENAAKYLHDFYTLAQEQSWKYFYFAAFDEEWKIVNTADADNTVEAYFGIFHKDRTLKTEIAALTFNSQSEESAQVPTSSNSSGSKNAGSFSENTSSNGDNTDNTNQISGGDNTDNISQITNESSSSKGNDESQTPSVTSTASATPQKCTA